MVFGGLPNKTAAMPSLHCRHRVPDRLLRHHAGCASAWRWLLLLYPVAMSLALIYSAEHYLIDAIMGAVIAALAMVDRRVVGPAGPRSMPG